jgi:peptidoglycan/LPS O-acetylase OafA/YrhL
VVVGHGTHMLFRFGPPSASLTNLLNSIGFGMTTFFVLSGFVIHYNYAHFVVSGWRNIGNFLWARLSRLYPMFLFVLVADVIFGQKLNAVMLGRADEFREAVQAVPYYLLFIQSWIYRAFDTSSLIYLVGIDSPLTWSVSTEWFFYLCYPVIALAVLKVNRRALIAIVFWSIGWSILINTLVGYGNEVDTWAAVNYGKLAALGSGGNQDSFYRWLFYFSPYFRIGEFILGALAAQLYIQLQSFKVEAREKLCGDIALGLGLLSLPVFAHFIYSPTDSWPILQRMNLNFALGPSVAVIIFCAARYPSKLSRALSSKPVVTFGDASYSIYLLHFLVFAIISGYVGQQLEPSWSNIGLVSMRFIFALAALLLLSLGTYRAIERPAQQWLRSLLPKQRTFVLLVPVVAAALVFVVTRADTTVEGIRVVNATYGANCGAQIGNVTIPLQRACNGKARCDYTVDVNVLGDPVGGCPKSFTAEYRCGTHPALIAGELAAEAHQKQIVLACSINR